MTSEWAETGSADNEEITVTRAAEAGRAHYATMIVASYDGSQSGMLVLKSGGTTLLEVQVFDELDIEFTAPVLGEEGKAMTLTFDASGTGGSLGYVTLMGYSV